MNIQRAREWLDLLKQACVEHPEPECQLMNVCTSCDTPGCVAGWTFQLMKDHPIFDKIKLKNYEYDNVARRLLTYFELREGEVLVDYFSTLNHIGFLWSNCFKLKGNHHPFADARAYTQEPLKYNDIPLSLVVERWEEFINFMEKRNDSQIPC